MQQDLTPLQVALDKGHPGVVKLLRASPFIVPPPQEAVPAPVPGANGDEAASSIHPFRNYDGLQKYTEEIIRSAEEYWRLGFEG